MFSKRLYAHRGAPTEFPENTLPSFQRALELGVDALETDIHLTRDGVPLISHDPSALRLTGHDVRIADTDVATLQALDAGWGFTTPDGHRPYVGRGIVLPTLEAVLTTFPEVRFNIDLKATNPRLAEVTMALLRRLRAEHRVTLASFTARTLLRLRHAGYAGETAMAQAEVPSVWAVPTALWERLPWRPSAAQVPTHAGPLRLDTPAFIARCHARQLRVDYWTINTVAEAERLMQLGADGIMTDEPALLAPWWRSTHGPTEKAHRGA